MKTPSRRARRELLEAKITHRLALDFSIAAFENALQLLAAADHLYSMQQHGPALSLAISAREEIGKLCVAMFYCTGQIDSRRFVHLIWGHHSKQTLGGMLALFMHRFQDRMGILQEITSTPVSSMAELFDVADSRIQSVLDALEPLDGDTLAQFQDHAVRSQQGDDDARRTAGLYADLVDRDGELEVRTPITVSSDEARSEIEVTRAYLSYMSSVVGAIQVADGGADLTSEDVLQQLQRFAAKYPLGKPDHQK